MIGWFCFFILILSSEGQKRGVHLCGKHEIYVDCVNPCEPTCSSPDRPKCPTWTCSPGCQCADGFLRAFDDPFSRCAKCRRKNSCGRNEVFSTCVNPCQTSCSWPDRPACPTSTCSTGCECRSNYFRATNSTDSPCIRC